MRPWYATPEKPWQPLLLSNPSLDLAVAWGAAHYGWLRHSGGRRIGGGIARSYYIAVETGERPTPAEGGPSESEAAAAENRQRLAVLCVVPQRLEEGQEIALERPELELALGQPVMFPLYTSTVRRGDHAGDLLQVAPDQLLQLPPLHTILRGGKRAGTKRVPVTLAARCTEIGTLELWCVARDGGNRWRLECNVRDIVKADAAGRPADEDARPGLTDVWPEAQVQEAGRLIRAVYAETPAPDIRPQDLTKALEVALDAPRHEWPT